jgi:hypothetical protein
MTTRVGSVFVLGLVTMSLFGATAAYATLGEKADSVERDRRALSAAKRALTAYDNYQVQEVAMGGTTIREYLAPSGVVFAVAWNGLAHPDFETILGSYTGDYRKAKTSTPRKHGQRSARFVGSQVIVETGGHMRDLRGRAYVPSLVPEGVNINEIR